MQQHNRPLHVHRGRERPTMRPMRRPLGAGETRRLQEMRHVRQHAAGRRERARDQSGRHRERQQRLVADVQSEQQAGEARERVECDQRLDRSEPVRSNAARFVAALDQDRADRPARPQTHDRVQHQRQDQAAHTASRRRRALQQGHQRPAHQTRHTRQDHRRSGPRGRQELQEHHRRAAANLRESSRSDREA